METYWHRLCRSLPEASYPEAAALAKTTGVRPSVSRYHKLWEVIRSSGKTAEGLALLSEACRIWPKATSLKVELATLYLNQGDGRQVTQLISISEAQKDPTSGWLVLKAALLCSKTEWVRVLSGSLAIAKLDKSNQEQRCLEYCLDQQWQEAADCVRRHHGLPLAPAPAGSSACSFAHSQRSQNGQQERSYAGASRASGKVSGADFMGCMAVDCQDLAEWLDCGAVTAEHGPWRTWLDQLALQHRAYDGEHSLPQPQQCSVPEQSHRLPKSLLEAARHLANGPKCRGPKSSSYDRMAEANEESKAEAEQECKAGQLFRRKELVKKLLHTAKNQQP